MEIHRRLAPVADLAFGEIFQVHMLRKCITAVFVAIGLSAFQAAGQLPIIMVQPKQQAAPFEGKAVFDVVAAKAEDLRFQWQKDGQPISAETNSYMVLNNLRYTDAGQYSVRISNDAGDITSSAAEFRQ